MGALPVYTQKTLDEICERIADGESLRHICQDEHMPDKAQVFRWLSHNAEFRDQYAHARECQAEVFADDLINIADDARNDTQVDDAGNVIVSQDVIARAKLRIDTRKWVASKLKPKKYGDKISNEITGADGEPLKVNLNVNFVGAKRDNGKS